MSLVPLFRNLLKRIVLLFLLQFPCHVLFWKVCYSVGYCLRIVRMLSSLLTLLFGCCCFLFDLKNPEWIRGQFFRVYIKIRIGNATSSTFGVLFLFVAQYAGLPNELAVDV